MDSFYLRSGDERLPAQQSSVFVQLLETQVNFSQKINLFTNHKHHLPSMFIHVDSIHVDGNLNNGPCIAIMGYPNPQNTLEQHLQSLEEENIVPVMKFREVYDYVPEEVRLIIKAIISALIYLHTRGASLIGPLTHQNFVIYDNYLALQDLSLIESTEETRRVDFQYVSRFINDNIFQNSYGERIPEDMRNLLDTLNSYEDKKKMLVAYHCATMSHSERIYFMKNCWDNKNTIEHYHRPITGIKMMPTDPEGKKQMWGTLIHTYNFKELLNCYNHRKYRFDHNSGTYFCKYYLGIEHTYLSNESGIRCCRNLATHLGEQKADGGIVLGEKDIDIMVSSVFIPMLVRFAEELHKREVLPKFITWME